MKRKQIPGIFMPPEAATPLRKKKKSKPPKKATYGAKTQIKKRLSEGAANKELYSEFPNLSHDYIRHVVSEHKKENNIHTEPLNPGRKKGDLGKYNPSSEAAIIEEKKQIMEDDPFLSGMKGLVDLGKDIFKHNSSNPTPEEKKNDVRWEDAKPSPEKEPAIEPTGKESGEWVITPRRQERFDPFDNDR